MLLRTPRFQVDWVPAFAGMTSEHGVRPAGSDPDHAARGRIALSWSAIWRRRAISS